MIHDGLFRYVLHWPEYLVFIFYAIAFPVFLFRHRQIILSQTEYWILGLGFFLAGLSVTMDLKLLPGSIDLEDGCKLFGMAAYAYYWIFTAKDMVARTVTDESKPPVR
ncbi:MAG TPA: hypothetical protein PKA41_20185, partial [Verrucomicrobiota bacterium]|nr:hypothetical protein [Verrucomicrobiota bacterium]